jgi:DNA-binding XRE family transcriptional regulator
MAFIVWSSRSSAPGQQEKTPISILFWLLVSGSFCRVKEIVVFTAAFVKGNIRKIYWNFSNLGCKMLMKRGKTKMKWTPERIKQLRKRLGENQEEFAKRFRLTIHAIQFWEQSKGLPNGPATVLLDQIEQEAESRHLQPA